MMCDIQGVKYPSADGLTFASPELFKAYTEAMQGHGVGCQIDEYKHTKFYTFIDYTGHQNIFSLPEISVESGERVSNRFINLRVEFEEALAGSALKSHIYHLCKKIMVFNQNATMDILE